jgi:DNA-binding response OmpR family regulator
LTNIIASLKAQNLQEIIMLKKKLLIVEDDDDLRLVLQKRLEMESFEVITASDGTEGWYKVKHLHPELVILDLGLPKLPGEEICREIRRSEETKNIPVIMLTGKGTDTDRIIGRVIGATHYLTKPFEMSELLDKIHRAEE